MGVYVFHFLWAATGFLLFAVVCGMLVESRFDRRGTFLVAAGFLFGIAAAQATLLVFGQDATLVLTLLPLTAYLPAIVGVHVVSRSGFFQTVAVWVVACLATFILAFLQKLLTVNALGSALVGGTPAQTLSLLLAAILMALVVWRWLRAPFRAYVLRGETSWLPLCLAVVAVLLLLSYFENSTANPTVTALVFLIALSVLLIASRQLAASAAARQAREVEQAASALLDIQRAEYEGLLKKLEAGRAYRHDMKHHLLALQELADEGNNEDIKSYLEGMGARLSETEPKRYCENPSANAVLVSCIARAEEEGCAVSVKADIPTKLSFDELDVCVLLANALENATNACKAVAEGKRAIHLTVMFEGDRNLLVSVENPCAEPVRFDAVGLPVAKEREGRGIGLKSINAVVGKYDGMLSCACDEGVFRLRAVLSVAQEGCKTAPKRRPAPLRRVAQGTASLVCALLVAAGCLPLVARAAQGWPGADAALGADSVRVEQFRWGDTEFRAFVPKVELSAEAIKVASAPSIEAFKPKREAPRTPASPAQPATHKPAPPLKPPASGVISWEGDADGGSAPTAPVVTLPVEPTVPSEPDATGDPSGSEDANANLVEGVDDINRQMEEYVAAMRDEFIWYTARKYQGYTGMDIIYEVVRNDDALLSIRFDATLNAGSSDACTRTFMLDKRTGKVLELADLFVPGSDYVSTISADVLRQMTEQVNAGVADYFIPGGIWRPDDCFQSIDPDQDFYIDDANRLVIVFEEYEVAPGKEGVPEFTVPTEVLAHILRSPSLIG